MPADYGAPVGVDKSPVFLRMSVEAAAATLSALTVAPAISIVDKAIVSNASGLEPLVPCLINGVKTLLTKPVYFFKQPSFLFIWGVYSGTYIVANNIDALCERSSRSSFYPKFVGSSFANVTLSVLKDKAFARMFGTGAPAPMSYTSMGLFATRDSMTILASFSLPDIVSQRMQASVGMGKVSADTWAQLLTPVTMQIFSTPLHLHGLDLYNRPHLEAATATGTLPSSSTSTAAKEAPPLSRTAFVAKEYVKTVLARMARILPAFGVGGVVNKYIRKSGRDYLVGAYK